MTNFFNYDRFNYPMVRVFYLFDIQHLGMLMILLWIIIAATFYYKSLDQENRIKMRKVMALSMVSVHIIRQISFVTLQNMAPISMFNINMCPLMIWTSLFHAFKPSKLTANLMYGIGIPSFTLALLFPDWVMLPFFNFYGLEQWLMHGALLTYIIMQISAKDYRPEMKYVPRISLIVISCIPIIYTINHFLGTNFWFMSAGSDGSPLDILISIFGTPWFIIPYVIIFASIVTVLYLPWQRNTKEKTVLETNKMIVD